MPATVIGHFESHVRSGAANQALLVDGSWYSYAEVDRRANQMAHALRERGASAGDCIAVIFAHGLECACALLAIQKIGAVYVPVDPTVPAERAAHMVSESRARLVLSGFDAATCIGAAAGGWRPADTSLVFDVPTESQRIARQPTSSPGVEVGADHLLCILYTSGSTGVPKGVELTQTNVVNCLLWMQQEYALGASDLMLHKTPYSFDVSMYELFWPLMVGARVAVSKPDGNKDPGYLVELIAEAGVTAAHFVPSMMAALLEEPEIAACRRLRKVFAAGEALTYALTQRFYECLPGTELHNLYGPTEGGVVSYWPCPKHEPRGIVPIGFPVANTTLHVLDEQGGVVARGEEGELFIGGLQVARGYLQRPDLTAERFIVHPQFGRLYKSGDIVRELIDGALEYKGRRDFQVKIGGVRIELGEIEAQLNTHPAVVESVAGIHEPSPGDQRIVVWFKARPGAPPIGELREYLRGRLPPAMNPHFLLVLDELPHLPNGKIDRRKLPAPAAEGTLERTIVPPATSTERIIAALWSQALGTDAIGRNDRFIDLGGHSLLAVRVAARLRRQFGKRLPLRHVLMESLSVLAQHYDPQAGAAVAPAGAAGEEPRQEPFYFGAEGRALFGVLSVAESPRETAVLICHTFGQEYMRSHRALRLLADTLANRGFATMRFDYACTGDSAGEAEEGRAEEWIDNIAVAARELQRRTGARQLCVIGLRLGGLLASHAVQSLQDIGLLLLWDAPPDGASWIAEAQQLSNREFRAWNAQLAPWAKLPPVPKREVLGMLFEDSFPSLSVLSLREPPAGAHGIYLSSSDTPAPTPTDRYDIVSLPEAGHWLHLQWLHTAWNPALSVKLLVQRLSEELP